MALFAFDYKLLSYLNSFDNLSKDRYLTYTNKYDKPFKRLAINNVDYQFKIITIDKMPLYCKNPNLGQYFLECADTTCSFNIYEYLT